VCLVRRVVARCHHPFGQPEDSAWFEHARDAGIDGWQGGRVDGRFGGAGGAEGLVWEGEVLCWEQLVCLIRVWKVGVTKKSPRIKVHLSLSPACAVISMGTIDLALVGGDVDGFAVDELCSLARRPADAAADVEHLHAGLQAHQRGEEVFVERYSLLGRVAWRERAVVEVLTRRGRLLLRSCSTWERVNARSGLGHRQGKHIDLHPQQQSPGALAAPRL
jgi:hypothetical protein